MNGNIKVLLYIFFVVIIFIYIQEKFSLFDIASIQSNKGKQSVTNEKFDTEDTVEIYNSDGNTVLVKVEIADDAFSHTVGLSGRRYLGDYEGMLFIMEKEGITSFWMKEMEIPLDMIFIDTKGFIVDIKKNLTPCEAEFCPHILARYPFKYVLEVNAGFSELNNIVVGNSMIFNILSRD